MDDLSQPVCFDFIVHAWQAENTHRSAERALFSAIKSKQPNRDKSSIMPNHTYDNARLSVV